MAAGFQLHAQLQKDCFVLGQFPLSLLLLMNDANYPWFILVPQRPGLREIFELRETDQQQLLRESSALSLAMVNIYSPEKLNIAALGNIVPQLHMHHIARTKNDPAWPAPVWGRVPSKAYEREKLDVVVGLIRNELADASFTPTE